MCPLWSERRSPFRNTCSVSSAGFIPACYISPLIFVFFPALGAVMSATPGQNQYSRLSPVRGRVALGLVVSFPVQWTSVLLYFSRKLNNVVSLLLFLLPLRYATPSLKYSSPAQCPFRPFFMATQRQWSSVRRNGFWNTAFRIAVLIISYPLYINLQRASVSLRRCWYWDPTAAYQPLNGPCRPWQPVTSSLPVVSSLIQCFDNWHAPEEHLAIPGLKCRNTADFVVLSLSFFLLQPMPLLRQYPWNQSVQGPSYCNLLSSVTARPANALDVSVCNFRNNSIYSFAPYAHLLTLSLVIFGPTPVCMFDCFSCTTSVTTVIMS